MVNTSLPAAPACDAEPPLECGRTLAEVHFPHLSSKGICRLNNGSFGAAPRAVLEACERYRSAWCDDPDGFWLRTLPALRNSQVAIAEMFGGSADDYGVVDNLTVAATAVARWAERRVLRWVGEGGHQSVGSGSPCVLLNTFTYNAVRNSFLSVRDSLRLAGVDLVIIDVSLPFPCPSAAAIEAAYVETLTAIRARVESGEIWPLMASLDHISSLPAVVMPVASLVAACKAAGFATFVDGAHAPGYVAGLSVPSFGADFYAANLHKWCFAGAGAAFLWSTPAARAAGLHHPVVSHDYAREEPGVIRSERERLQRPDPPDFGSECRMLGSRDYAPMLAVPEALAFFRSVGRDAACLRNAALCRWAAALLTDAWRTVAASEDEGALWGDADGRPPRSGGPNRRRRGGVPAAAPLAPLGWVRRVCNPGPRDGAGLRSPMAPTQLCGVQS